MQYRSVVIMLAIIKYLYDVVKLLIADIRAITIRSYFRSSTLRVHISVVNFHKHLDNCFSQINAVTE